MHRGETLSHTAQAGSGDAHADTLDDAEFVRAVESGELPNARFGHRDHLRLAWLYLADSGPGRQAEARARMAATLRRFAARHGAAQRYHETLTVLWMRLVDAA